MANFDDLMLFIGAIPLFIAGLALSVRMVLMRYIYSALFFFTQMFFAVLAIYVYVNYEYIVEQPMFDFSVFTRDNIYLVICNSIGATIGILLVWITLSRSEFKEQSSLQSEVGSLLGSMNFFSRPFFYLSLFLSFVIALILFYTNPSILDLPYPINVHYQWMPYEFIKIPVFLAFLALMYCYVKLARVGGAEMGTMPQLTHLAKLNFLIVTILMLFLAGARGLFVFLWGVVAFFEFVFYFKKRCNPLVGVLFLLLSWFGYSAFPLFRSIASDVGLLEATLAFLYAGLGLDSTTYQVASDPYAIWLDDIPMFGQSLFHFLYVVDLEISGISRYGITFLNLLPQLLPEFLDGVFFTRPLNDNWILGDYYFHGGGFWLAANAYWNGGSLVMLLFICILAGIFCGLDRYFMGRRSGSLFKLIYWLWIPAMVVQIGYGIQGMVRVVEILLLIIFIERFFLNTSQQANTQLDKL